MSYGDIFKRKEVEANKDGWVVDLSPWDGPINPDYYWYFRTREEARRFLNLVISGVSTREAAWRATK